MMFNEEEYLQILEQAYLDQLGRLIDPEGKKDGMIQGALGRTKEELYKILAFSKESKENIGNKLEKYGKNNENERRRWMFKLGSRQIQSLNDLFRKIEAENSGWIYCKWIKIGLLIKG